MEQQIQQVVDELFPSYDKDRSGYLEGKELCHFLTDALQRLGIKTTVTESQAQQAIKVIDKDSDSKINKLEVGMAIKSILEYKMQQKGGSQGGNTQGTNQGMQNPPNQYQQPYQQPYQPYQQPTQPQNNWGNPNNSWSQPQNPGYQSYNQPYQQNPSYNNWSQPTYNNSWSQPPPQNNGWSQPGNNWQQPQPSYQSQDTEMQRLIDQLFMRFDRDRSGQLNRREFHRAINEFLQQYGVGLRLGPGQTASLLQQIDNSGDGSISKQQFFQMVKYLLQNQ